MPPSGTASGRPLIMGSRGLSNNGTTVAIAGGRLLGCRQWPFGWGRLRRERHGSRCLDRGTWCVVLGWAGSRHRPPPRIRSRLVRCVRTVPITQALPRSAPALARSPLGCRGGLGGPCAVSVSRPRPVCGGVHGRGAGPARRISPRPVRWKYTLVITWSMMKVTGHSAAPSAGTASMGSVQAIVMRMTASASIRGAPDDGGDPPGAAETPAPGPAGSSQDCATGGAPSWLPGRRRAFLPAVAGRRTKVAGRRVSRLARTMRPRRR